MADVFYTEVASPIGQLTLASTDQGICALSFGAAVLQLPLMQRRLEKWDPETDWIAAGDCGWLRQARKELEEYFSKSRSTFEVKVDVKGSTFQKLVWEQLQNIPYGETRSYKEIAVNMEVPKAVRAVGGANNRNPLPIIIPCHRVIGSNKSLVGYAGGLEIKKTLLETEGTLDKLLSS